MLQRILLLMVLGIINHTGTSVIDIGPMGPSIDSNTSSPPDDLLDLDYVTAQGDLLDPEDGSEEEEDSSEEEEEQGQAFLPLSKPRRNQTNEELLLRNLFYQYSADARAGMNSLKTVQVEIQYTLLRIQQLDERTQVLTTTGLVITEWNDERLQWDPLEYGNLTEIVMPPSMIWLPELTIMNGAENMVPDFERMGVLVTHTGLVHWEPGGNFATACDIDITFFPFDKQNCSIVVGAWAYYTQRMNLTNSTYKMMLHDYAENGEWEILNTKVEWGETQLPCCPGIAYSYVKSTLSLKRRIHYYFVNIMVPCFMLSVLVLVAFCIPPEAGEKISCGISVLLAFTVFLLMVSETVPKTSLQMPLLAIYLMSTMILGAMSLGLSIIVLNVHHLNQGKHVPRWVHVIILTLLAAILCMRTRSIRHRVVRPSALTRRSSRRLKERSPDHSSTHVYEHDRSPTSSWRGSRQSSRDDSPDYDNVDDCELSPSRMRALLQDVPYIYHVQDWQDVSRVLDRLFFWLVLMAMGIACVFTLCAGYLNTSS